MRLTEIEKIAFLNSKVPALVKALRRAVEMIVACSGDVILLNQRRAELAQLLRERDSADSVPDLTESDNGSGNSEPVLETLPAQIAGQPTDQKEQI